MNIIPLFNSFVNHLNNILDNNLFLHELERNISNSTYDLNLDILKQILEFLDLEYKNSNERKQKYYVQQIGIDNSNFTIKENYILDYFLSKRL